MLRLLFSMLTLGWLAAPAHAQAAPTVNINEYGPPEYGFGLTEKEALEGWISLFDGKSTFGWTQSKMDKDRLSGGETTSHFGPSLLHAEVIEPGQLIVANQVVTLSRGPCTAVVAPDKPATIRLAGGAVLRSLVLQPLKLAPLFNGKDLTGWKRIDRAKTPPDRLAKWTVENGAIHAVGGPSCLEYQERKFGDLIWQVEARMNVRQANGGLFFRAIPGDFMNGYEAQMYNRCIDGDPGKPAVWATGAIDDRQNARRLMSRDGHWFVQTVIAQGPHIATWVNGHQTVDWTDTRPKDPNPRQGLRVEPGVLQLQAHDTGTDIEFGKLSVRALD